jgi:hypothetical protein
MKAEVRSTLDCIFLDYDGSCIAGELRATASPQNIRAELPGHELFEHLPI